MIETQFKEQAITILRLYAKKLNILYGAEK